MHHQIRWFHPLHFCFLEGDGDGVNDKITRSILDAPGHPSNKMTTRDEIATQEFSKWKNCLPKINMTIEHLGFEDEFTIEHGDFPMSF